MTLETQLFKLIMRHLDVSEAILNYSKRMLLSVKEGDISRLELNTSNRERLINILRDLQGEIDRTAIKLAPYKNESISLIARSWLGDNQRLMEQVELTDARLIQAMEDHKLEIRKQIGGIFKNRKSLGGYNLSSVK